MPPISALDFTEQLMIFDECGMIYDRPEFVQANQVGRSHTNLPMRELALEFTDQGIDRRVGVDDMGRLCQIRKSTFLHGKFAVGLECCCWKKTWSFIRRYTLRLDCEATCTQRQEAVSSLEDCHISVTLNLTSQHVI